MAGIARGEKAAAALRRVIQHLQGRGARCRWSAQAPACAPQGRTRAFGPGHASLPEDLRPRGAVGIARRQHGHAISRRGRGQHEQDTCVFVGPPWRGRQTSRRQALKTWIGREVVDELKARGILVPNPSSRSVAEEASPKMWVPSSMPPSWLIWQKRSPAFSL